MCEQAGAAVTAPGSGKPVVQWTDDELHMALVALGGATAPVTPHTRQFLEKRVAKLLPKTRQQEPAVQQDTAVPEEADIRSEGPPAVEGSREGESTPQDGEFYGVVVEREGTPGFSSLSPFYTNKSEAVRAAKSVPGARFKKFSTRASAEAFSSSPVDWPASLEGRSPAASGEKKPNLFASLKTADLSRFRMLIEAGDVSGFSREVWANPRHLVNCYGDAPEVLQVGSRYNALHCAVKAGSREICQELVSILQNADFWRLVYPSDPPETVQQRRTHLVDLYLNMQDKIGETPLHFASKLGHLEIVRLLLSQPSLDLSLTNKYGQSAADVVCQSAKSTSTELKEKVTELINAPPVYYVPVLRAADNCTPPQLTPPCTISEYHHHQAALSDDRGTPMIGQAFAGPMSPAQAEVFYQEWRSPSSSRDWREALQIKRSDSSRGFERVGRQLAEQCEVGWREHWDFLGCYCDLRRSEGLQKLEDYLTSLSTPPPSPTPPPPQDTVTGGSMNVSRELFPSGENGREQVEGGHEVCEVGGRGRVTEKTEGELESDFESVLEGVAGLRVGGVGEGGRVEGVEGEGDQWKDGRCDKERVVTGEDGDKVKKGERDGGESNRSSLEPGMIQQEPLLTGTPTITGRRKTFLLGCEPTKLDHDVYLAVRGAAPGLCHYPHVADWVNRVEEFSEITQKSWKTPRSQPKLAPLPDSGKQQTDAQGSPLLVTSPPHSPLPRPPVLPSPHSPPHRLHTSTLSPRRHFSPLHRSLTASGTPSRLHRATPRPRQVLPPSGPL